MALTKKRITEFKKAISKLSEKEKDAILLEVFTNDAIRTMLQIVLALKK